MIDLRCGDARVVLATLPDACCDALISDPPAGVSFMGKGWDGHKGGRDQWIAWLAGIMAEARRVLKPGHQALVWALPRTSHWTATALDDAGFYVADVITHHFGSGFPKSRSLLKPASEHWILCRAPGALQPLQIDACRLPTSTDDPNRRDHPGRILRPNQVYGPESRSARAPTLQQGRWPPNTLFSHVGGPDGCQPAGVRRVRGHAGYPNGPGGSSCQFSQKGTHTTRAAPWAGHTDAEGYESVDAWTCVDGCPVAELDRQGGPRTSRPDARGTGRAHSGTKGGGGVYGASVPYDSQSSGQDRDASTVSRFFPTFGPDPQDAVPFRYVPKASRAERNQGLDGQPHAPVASYGRMAGTPEHGPKYDRPEQNNHPTVKPVALMAWLCRLIVPPDGTVLDPFCGSGSTGVACVREGFGFIGIEQSAEYVAIARARIAHEQERRDSQLALPLGHAYG